MVKAKTPPLLPFDSPKPTLETLAPEEREFAEGYRALLRILDWKPWSGLTAKDVREAVEDRRWRLDRIADSQTAKLMPELYADLRERLDGIALRRATEDIPWAWEELGLFDRDWDCLMRNFDRTEAGNPKTLADRALVHVEDALDTLAAHWVNAPWFEEFGEDWEGRLMMAHMEALRGGLKRKAAKALKEEFLEALEAFEKEAAA